MNKETSSSFIDFLWDNSMDRLGQGWYGWENGYRWTDTRATFYLSIPPPDVNHKRFFIIEGWLSGSVSKTVQLFVNGNLATNWNREPENNGKVRLAAPLPDSEIGGLVSECILVFSEPYIPSKDKNGSGDERALGMYVKKMMISTDRDAPWPKVKPDIGELLRFYILEIYKRAMRFDRKYPGNWISIYNFRKTKKAISLISMKNIEDEK